MAVFSRGIWNGLNTTIEVGGHWAPTSIVVFNLLWKKAQKNEKKNKISETINKIIPHRIPCVTFMVCKPWKEASRETSRHHWTEVIKTADNPSKNKLGENSWNHFTNPLVSNKALVEAKIGQGLFSTKW
jgi:hypothetical protein